MKILYIADIFGNISGAQKSAKDVLISLLSKNHEVIVLSYSNIKSVRKSIGKKSCNSLTWIKIPRNIPFPNQINRRFLRNIAKWFVGGSQDIFIGAYKKKLKRINVDIAIINDIGSHVLFTKLKIKEYNRSFIILRSSPESFKYDKRLNVNEVITILKQYSSIIFVSSIVRDKWLSFNSLSKKNSFYIPNCCEEDKILSLQLKDPLEIRKKYGIPINRFIAVCVSTIQQRKGQDLIVDNFNKIKKVAPDIILYFVGKVIFPWGKDLVKQIKLMNIDNDLKVMGNRIDALNFIYAADVFIFPTRAEALPRVILEAMALKTPVIASDVDGIPELIEHEKSGLLFPLDDSEKLIAAIKWMYDNKKERKKLAVNANAKYWLNFSRANQIDSYNKIIDEIIKI